MDPQIQKAIDEGKRIYENAQNNKLDNARRFIDKDGWLLGRIRDTAAKGFREFRISCNEYMLTVDFDSLFKAIQERKGLNVRMYERSYIVVYW